ncbi:methyltransferase [Thalassotalea agariperforans]
MLSPFFANDKNLHLERFPHAQVTRSLQAWDATDEYFFNYLEQEALINSSTKILIFNDTFGAIAINYLANPIATVSDSYLSHQGLKHNIEINNLDAEHVAYLTSLDDLPDDVDLIIYKIPKSKALLTEQLLKIGQKYCSTVNFVAGAKAKDIHSSTLKVFEKYLGTTKTSLAVKKSRLVFCQLEQPLKDKISYSDLFPNSWPLENTNFIITNHANVFAREKLDLGARFFLEHLPDLQPNQEVIDLGCGNGVVGLTALTQEPQISLRFIDESYMAVASAQQNIESNLPYAKQCQYMVDDCLTKIDNNSIDVILCNPPFHQLQATTDHIAWQMFNDAYRVLKKGGELRIIGNRNLAYHVKLQRIFGNAQTISSNKKFVVLSAIKNN